MIDDELADAMRNGMATGYQKSIINYQLLKAIIH